MAVEHPHMNHFSPQIIISNNREMVDEGFNNNVYEYGMNHMDSGLTFSLPISRKRSRDDSTSFDASDFNMCQNGQFVINGDEYNNTQKQQMFTFLGQDMSMQIYQQQLDIDRFIANHTEKVRLAVQATRQRNSMRIIAAAQEGMKNKLRSKDDEIMKISKLNYALEEKVKSLNVETQIWQQMAQTHEATANVLRLNLQQLLTQIQQPPQQTANNDVEDNESCCGSNYEEHNDNNNGNMLNRLCRNCGKLESCVLLLPCRHLCVCSACESSINHCPVCKSFKNASLHVNMN